MSYGIKYASTFQGPLFREATKLAHTFGGKKAYQMDPENSNETLI